MKKFVLFLCFLACVCATNPLRAQNKGFKFDAFVEVVSLYNFRAIDYGNSPAIQPKLSLFYDNFEFSAWGSQALIARTMHNDERTPFNEVDLSFKHYFYTPIGIFVPAVTDYFCPFREMDFWNYDGEKDGKSRGAHTINVACEYIVSKDVPLKITADYCFHNDPQHPFYLEALYQFYHENFIIEPYIGIAKGMGAGGFTEQYGIVDNKVGVCNLGLNVTKVIDVSEKFKLPVTSTLSIQPYTGKVWVVFKAKI